MVEATPQRVGQTFLHRLYDRLHALDINPEERPSGVRLYYTRVTLTDEEWLDLDWWEAALRLNVGVQAYSTNQGTLGISYGDGSGSGTGGMLQVIGRDGPCLILEAWMGTWRPTVHSFSSNWRELCTLVHTLERELGGVGRLAGSTLFYFTDNLVSYYIVSNGSSSSPELQKLLRRLKYLELVLGIRLEIVHIPGLHMIAQGTDGLSRGLRFPDGSLQRRPEAETRRIFAALPSTPEVIQWACNFIRPYQRLQDVTFMTSTKKWTFHDVSGRATLWFPAPEWAHQLIDAVLNVWVEQPWTTEAFFLVPRVFQRDWGRASKHVVECSIVAPAGIPTYGTLSNIPCILMHLLCYVRSLPLTRRLEPAPRPTGMEWHREQAELVRGMS